jgi:ADP-heptose:LPS heptosyltransferase
VRNQWDLLEAIDGWPAAEPDPSKDSVEMARDAQAEARIARRLDGFGITPAHELIVVHVSAGNPFRRWPEPAFTTLVAALAAESPSRRIVLGSGPSDRDAAPHRRRGRALGPASGRVLDFGSSTWRS